MTDYTMKITRRDKVLLYILSIAVIIFIFFRFVFVPLSDDISSLETEIEQAEFDKFDMMLITSQYDTLAAENQELLDVHDSALAGFYPSMKSYEIDKLITNMALSNGLDVSNLSISSSPSVRTLAPYIYSEYAAEQPTLSGTPDILSASATLKVTGGSASISSMIDEVTTLSSMRIVSYELAEVNVDAGYDENGRKLTAVTTQLTLTLEIYMY